MSPDLQGPFDSASPSGSGSGQIDWKRIIHILQKYFWVLILTTGAATTLAWFVTKKKTPLYKTHATIVISSQLPSYLGSQIKTNLTELSDDYWYAKRYLETQFEVIRSRNISYLTVQRLESKKVFQILGLKNIPERAPNTDEMSAAANILRSSLSVIPIQDSRIVQIQVISPNPELARDLANAVMETYIDENLERRISSTKSASTWLDSQLKSLKEKLDEADKKLLDFHIKNGIYDVNLAEKMSRLTKIVGERTLYNENAERKAEQLAEKLKIFKSLQAKNPVNDPRLDFSGKEHIYALRAGYYSNYLKLQNDRIEFLEKHPQVIQGEKSLKIISDNITNEIKLIEISIAADYRLSLKVLARSRQALEQAFTEAHSLAKLEVEHAKIKRERDEIAKLYDLVLARHKETGLAEELKTNNIRPLDNAMLPRMPFSPRLSVNLMLGFALGMFIGLMFLVLFYYLDNTVKSQDELEMYLGCPFLGYLPMLPPRPDDRQSRAYYIFNHPRSTIAEAIRTIRTNIVFATPDNPIKTLMITSSMPLEGKTTISSYIAISMAMSGEKTLLIDGDMRKPTIHKTFGQKPQRGLSSLIVKKSEVEDSIIISDIENLHVLPCGPIPPNPAELEQSSNFKELLEKLKGLYDKVIIDTPPVGLVTDPVIIAQVVDAVLIVTRHGRSTRPAIRYTRRAMSGKARIIGSVMNYVDSSKWGSKAYYYGGSRGGYYTYSYGYHREEDEASTADTPEPEDKKKSKS
ncbi:polysaccharide biosynthesis tyrosine autokinase [Myxococcota bacterium]|nr:polysaccharide biosynthesis tyrosine autokinase [Myxococcota bacterium]MBU1380686.1 polysaccharide biosynthesis tyrosine autokinase [Myxococcota bacterium]MBU1495894.1 polysaccharide biosynthesis tyrosine autokinase [Myxococcota bacterium]